MKKKVIILQVFLLCCLQLSDAQKLLTLKECFNMALASNAIAGESEIYENIWSLKDENLSKGWLPTLDANANILYNSEVVDISNVLSDLPVPGIADAINPLPHDQYRITLDINQVIYDGGVIKGTRAVEKASLDVVREQTTADLYRLKSQVINCYFSILILEKQEELLKTYLELAEKRISSFNSALNSGIILKSDLDVITSEKIKLIQQITENEIKSTSLLKVLSDLTGSEIGRDAELTVPETDIELSFDISRPELRIYDLKKTELEAGLDILQSKRLPKAYGFMTLGYGNPPGNNFFRDEFDTYYIIGGGIRWNIYDWNRVKNEKQQLKLQQGVIENRKNDLTDNLIRSLESKKAEIESLKKLIETDAEIITLRKRITVSAESKYENGTITATEYLNEVNAEKQALINYEIHKINLVLAQVEFMNISGKELE